MLKILQEVQKPVVQINTEGMQVAELDDTQLNRLMQAEKEINNNAGKEIYLLAVQRQ